MNASLKRWVTRTDAGNRRGAEDGEIEFVCIKARKACCWTDSDAQAHVGAAFVLCRKDREGGEANGRRTSLVRRTVAQAREHRIKIANEPRAFAKRNFLHR